MTENLPVAKSSQDLSTKLASKSTLLRRGLATIHNRQLLIANQDEQYRKARDIYNRTTHHGWEFFVNEGENLPVSVPRTEKINNHLIIYKLPRSLSDIFDVLKYLVEQDYGKAYLPLASFYYIFQYQQDYDDEYEILENKMIQLQTRGLAWCLDNNETNEHEILADLAINYLMGYWSEIDKKYHEDVEKSFSLYSRLAELGYPEAQYALSWICRHRETEVDRYISWLHLSADQNYPIAQYDLAGCYYVGECVKKNLQISFSWYHKAAIQEYLPAQTDLGIMYLNGEGIHQDTERAIYWFKQAANQGYGRAKEFLSRLDGT